MQHSDEIIIDADYTNHTWEIVARHGPEDMVGAWTDLTDDQLRVKASLIGERLIEELIAVKNRQHA